MTTSRFHATVTPHLAQGWGTNQDLAGQPTIPPAGTNASYAEDASAGGDPIVEPCELLEVALQRLELERVRAQIAQSGAQFVDLKIVDLVGRWRHITIPAKRLDQHLLETGVAFDGSNFGYAGVAGSDLTIVPDLATLSEETIDGRPVASLICDICRSDGTPFAGDPRQIAARAEAFVIDQGIAEAVRLSPEFEFYAFEEAAFECSACSTGFRILPLNNRDEISYYHISPPEDKLFALRNEICLQLETLGIEVKYHHHEVGPFGQAEIELGFAGLVEMADATLRIKNVVRSAAKRAGWTATFMPKPIPDQAGSGLHVHQFLARDGKSVFEEDGGLSETALCYAGGLLAHGPGLMGLTNPSTNSYRRLVPGYEAPVSFTFGEGNRSAAIRVPMYATADERRIELRTADATCNPYLAYAAMVMAGVDGILRRLHATELGFGPHSCDLFSLPADERDKIVSAPTDLSHALDALAADHEYLLAGDVFPDGFVEKWIDAKTAELRRVQQWTHPREFVLYYDL